ncbi:MAG TPA: hypothetical protein VFT22_12320, partial [Kofleriaceae bacterium]|nr:hypothetical protein [Kofleriaceae bacterium]
EPTDMREAWTGLFDSFSRTPPLVGENLWAPLADVEETEDAWLIKAELPGVNSNDLEIEALTHGAVDHGRVEGGARGEGPRGLDALPTSALEATAASRPGVGTAPHGRRRTWSG